MYILRFPFFAGLLVLGLAIGCKAQSTQPTMTGPELNRRIEVLVRSQFNVPQDYSVTVGARTPSQVPGYDTLPIAFSRGAKSSTTNFLISSDGKTLARLETFDLAKDPAFHIDTQGRPIRGNPAAKVTLINFDDLECPYCAKMHQSLFPSTLDRYKDKVRFIYKDYPLAEVHPWAIHAAVDANCLAAQSADVYWTYVDYLHAHGQEITGEDRDPSKSNAALDRIARQESHAGQTRLGEARCLPSQAGRNPGPRIDAGGRQTRGRFDAFPLRGWRTDRGLAPGGPDMDGHRSSPARGRGTAASTAHSLSSRACHREQRLRQVVVKQGVVDRYFRTFFKTRSGRV